MRPLLALLLLGASLCAQTHVTGTVVNALTGEPIPGATVAARTTDDAVDNFGFHRRTADLVHPSRTVTDDAGRFNFDADPSLASFQIAISHPGFRSEDNRDAATVTASVSDNRELHIRLSPVSLIRGTIMSSAGEPLPNITVQAIRVEIHEGRQLRTPFAAKDTNERGEYRFDALPAGAYFLRATSTPSAPSSSSAPAAAFGPTYFPAASNPDSAQSLRVIPGRAVTADFILESHATYRIRGIVTNPPPRRPLAMRLLRGDDPLGNSASFSPNGTFDMASLAPGSYILQAYTPNSTPPDFGETTITVTDHDLVGTKITLTNGVDISGHVEFKGPVGSEHYAQIRAIAVNSRRWPVNIAEPSVVANDRGNFLLKNLLPGQYDIAVRGLSDFYVADIHAGPNDVLADGLTIKADDSPHLNIVMQSGGGNLEGIVEGAGTANYQVALLAQHASAQVPTIVRAVQGRFHAAGLTPGEYTLYAWPESRAIEYRNPWALADLSKASTTVTVRDASSQIVTVKPIP
ncbi:MAG TPA: carboxypeptidase-like regulatory domain-containing protein [Bryobacteraceae bacterium]|jgi:hypothetical protein